MRLQRASGVLSLAVVLPLSAAASWIKSPGFRPTCRASSSTKLASAQDDTTISLQDSLKKHGTPGVKFVDGSFFLKDRVGRDEFEQGPRIEGALFFDINDIAAKGTLNPKNLPHMMPPKELFAAAMDAMSIQNEDELIVYGTKDCMFMHRTWFQLKAMGHDKVRLMQGSLDDWTQQGGPVDTEPVQILKADDLALDAPTKYVARDPPNIVSMDQVLEIVQSPKDTTFQIVDVRNADRFYGRVDEPRPGLRKGHMPGAINLFFLDLLNPENVAQLKPKDELEHIFKDAGLEPTRPQPKLVASCGSGVTTCALVAALTVCGRDFEDCYVYDGSWSEWGADPNVPIVQNDDS